ncbi:MAG TPA: choline-sulfatase [Clostridiales bacterium]|nr:choline-sulfatase [Clostridiales bacterium]
MDKTSLKPNILFIMTDQQRFDTIAALGNSSIYTPNLDRLVRRGISFDNGYTPCPVCVPARLCVRTGCEPVKTRLYDNGYYKETNLWPDLDENRLNTVYEDRFGAYLPRRMNQLGYRTFGIGKEHSLPVYEDIGHEVHLHTEEFYFSVEDRNEHDAYASWLRKEHSEKCDWLEMLQGERTEMYYQPQMSPLPANLTVESFVADRAVEQIKSSDTRPYFGCISFIGPHPPFAPPIPFNRMYDPDHMPDPVLGKSELDFMDEVVPWLNYAVYREEFTLSQARILKSRYYGEISYIDHCLGRILDAVESRTDADNTLICFYSDHGELIGDHHSWTKCNFFEGSCHIPFLVSWPECLPKNQRRDELASLVDLFGMATVAAGSPEMRDGTDLIGVIEGTAKPRKQLFSYFGAPGSVFFKIMVREGDWKYIFIANGGREQLFNLKDDPDELIQRAETERDISIRLRKAAVEKMRKIHAELALEGSDFKGFEYEPLNRVRIRQFAYEYGVNNFAAKPPDAFNIGIKQKFTAL